MLRINWKLLLIVFVFLGIAELSAQKDVEIVNGKSINPNRYDRYIGDPYWFDDWREATLVNNDFLVMEGILINFNGDTREVEVRKGDEFVELARSYYLRIEIEPLPGEGQETLIFQRGAHASFGDKFMQIMYRSNNFILAKEFYCDLVEPHVETIHGSNSKFRFAKKEVVHFCENGRSRVVRRKPAQIVKLFDGNAAMKNYLKKNKPNLRSDEELVKLFRFYEDSVLGIK